MDITRIARYVSVSSNARCSLIIWCSSELWISERDDVSRSRIPQWSRPINRLIDRSHIQPNTAKCEWAAKKQRETKDKKKNNKTRNLISKRHFSASSQAQSMEKKCEKLPSIEFQYHASVCKCQNVILFLTIPTKCKIFASATWQIDQKKVGKTCQMIHSIHNECWFVRALTYWMIIVGISCILCASANREGLAKIWDSRKRAWSDRNRIAFRCRSTKCADNGDDLMFLSRRIDRVAQQQWRMAFPVHAIDEAFERKIWIKKNRGS